MDDSRKRAQDETCRLLEQGDPETLISTAAQRVLESVEHFVDAICNGVPFASLSDFNVSLLLRCVARKSQESLMSITKLVVDEQTYYAMPLLRPMCEELIFIRFMKSLPREEANDYLWRRLSLDLLEGLKAQRGFFDKLQDEYPYDVREKYRPHRRETQDLPTKISEQRTALKDMGKRLGWGNRYAPSVKYMAESTGSDDEYGFFYHATSSAVHANLHHVGRMVWGDLDQGVVITNENFAAYYRHFALTYGAWLTAKIMDEVNTEFPEQWHNGALVDYDIWRDFVQFIVGATRFPPIVTEEELRWKSRSEETS